MNLFDGYAFAEKKERELKSLVEHMLLLGRQPHVAAILFKEDAGSQLYTQLKKQAAQRVGIVYEVHPFSLMDNKEQIAAEIERLNTDNQVTGIIIQKPTRQKWIDATGKTREDFSVWWRSLVSRISLEKDVDGLHPMTLAAIQKGDWKEQGRVLPATVKAVLMILESAHLITLRQSPEHAQTKIIILGKSDILGQPLFYELKNLEYSVEMIGSKELQQRSEEHRFLHDADIVISSTGHPQLITGEMIKNGAAVIDVGEPKGDVEVSTVMTKAEFLTPVPGGVGPVTVVSLLENAADLLNTIQQANE